MVANRKSKDERMKNIENLKSNGYLVVDSVLDETELGDISRCCDSQFKVRVGTRSLLDLDWVQHLAQKLKTHPELAPLMPAQAKAVQCNYFAKDMNSNWSVSLHRDLSIPVKSHVSVEGWSDGSIKEGICFMQPPKEFLQSLLIVRLHLEDNTPDNGALELVAGSHQNNASTGMRQLVPVNKGGVLLLRPLTLHASTKVRVGQRRVLHFVFAPEKLPNNIEWKWSI